MHNSFRFYFIFYYFIHCKKKTDFLSRFRTNLSLFKTDLNFSKNFEKVMNSIDDSKYRFYSSDS